MKTHNSSTWVTPVGFQSQGYLYDIRLRNRSAAEFYVVSLGVEAARSYEDGLVSDEAVATMAAAFELLLGAKPRFYPPEQLARDLLLLWEKK